MNNFEEFLMAQQEAARLLRLAVTTEKDGTSYAHFQNMGVYIGKMRKLYKQLTKGEKQLTKDGHNG